MAKKNEPQEHAFPIEQLAQSGDALGYPNYVVAGALAEVEGPITKAEAIERIEAYLATPVDPVGEPKEEETAEASDNTEVGE